MDKLFACLTLLLFVGLSPLAAQDILHFTNGDSVKAKVLEVRPYEIKYQKYDNLDGPLYTIKKSKIERIDYQNGQTEDFSKVRNESMWHPVEDIQIVDEETSFYKWKRLMGQDYFQLYFGNLHFFTEGWASKRFAMKLSLYLNYKPLEEDKKSGFPLEYGFGMNPKFFVYNHKIIRVFLGPEFSHGFSLYKNTLQNCYWDYSQGVNYCDDSYDQILPSLENIAMADAGIEITPIMGLNITLNFGVGMYASVIYDDLFEADLETGPAWRLGLNLGRYVEQLNLPQQPPLPEWHFLRRLYLSDLISGAQSNALLKRIFPYL